MSCSVKSKHKTSFLFRFGLAFALVSLLRLGLGYCFCFFENQEDILWPLLAVFVAKSYGEVNEEGARGENLWSTCRATKTFVAGWRTAAHWMVDLFGMDPRWRRLLRDKLWVWWKKSNKANSCMSKSSPALSVLFATTRRTASWEFLYVIFRQLYAQTGHPCTARSVWPDTALISRKLTPSICKVANPTGKFWQMLNANCISAHRVELEEERTIQPTTY